jgi:hypothetical protein
VGIFLKEKVIFWRIFFSYVFMILFRTFDLIATGKGGWKLALMVMGYFYLIYLPLFIAYYFMLLCKPSFDLAFRKKALQKLT